MKPKTIKVLNNANEVIEVTEKAWEVLYKEREGFSLYVKENEEKPKAKPKITSKKKPSSTTKKVKKDD